MYMDQDFSLQSRGISAGGEIVGSLPSFSAPRVRLPEGAEYHISLPAKRGSGNVHELSFSPDGKSLAVAQHACRLNVVALAENGQSRLTLCEEIKGSGFRSVESVRFLPDGENLFFTTKGCHVGDLIARIVSSERRSWTGGPRREAEFQLPRSEFCVQAATIDHGGNSVVLSSYSGQLALATKTGQGWALRGSEYVSTGHGAYKFGFGADDKILVVGGGTVAHSLIESPAGGAHVEALCAPKSSTYSAFRLEHAATGVKLEKVGRCTLPGLVRAIDVSSDGEMVAVANYESEILTILEVRGSRESGGINYLKQVKFDSPITALRFGPGRNSLAVGLECGEVVDLSIAVGRPIENSDINESYRTGFAPDAIAFSPDGRRLAIGGYTPGDPRSQVLVYACNQR